MVQRPWTVYALVGFSVASLVWGLFGGLGPVDVLVTLLGIWIIYSMWTAKAWAFTVSFMLFSLCAGVLATVVGVQILLLERGLDTSFLWALVSSAVFIGLLMHPDTKRFAGINPTHPSS